MELEVGHASQHCGEHRARYPRLDPRPCVGASWALDPSGCAGSERPRSCGCAARVQTKSVAGATGILTAWQDAKVGITFTCEALVIRCNACFAICDGTKNCTSCVMNLGNNQNIQYSILTMVALALVNDGHDTVYEKYRRYVDLHGFFASFFSLSLSP